MTDSTASHTEILTLPTPENHLHLLGLAGGWPGAWFAQHLLRHKTTKAAFRRRYWATVVLHCLALLAWSLGWVG